MSRNFNSRIEKEQLTSELHPIYFGDLLRRDGINIIYEDIKDKTKLIKYLDEKQEDYNYSIQGNSL